MRKFILSWLFFSLAGWSSGQLQAPAFFCDSVHPDGSVTLIWEQVSDPGNIFTAYSVYYRPTPAAAFTFVDAVTDIAQVSYTHTDAAANDRSRFYYLQTESTQGPSGPSDTLETIFLYFETDDNEHVSLYWNALHDPPLPTPNVSYVVRMEYPPGVYQTLTITQALNFDYHFWFCNSDKHVVKFQVITQDFSAGCQSTSNISGAVLSNLGQPDKPAIDSVSISPDGNAIMGWQAGLAPDIAGYIVYRVTTINDSIAFLPGMDSTFYIDQYSQPCDGPLKYAIASVDSCGNKSPGTFLQPHRTLFLRDIEYDPCLLENTISWTPYLNFDPPLLGYELYCSVDSGPFILLHAPGPGDTAFIHSSLLPNTLYGYYVRAFSEDRSKTSTSCTREVRTFNSPVPQFMYLRYATVNEGRSVDISFYSDTSAHVRGYKVYRSDDMVTFNEIGQVEPEDSDVLYFTDEQANTSQESYYYRVSVIDSCLNESDIANMARTILLSVQSNGDLTSDLSWNAYESWDADVDLYRIYRRVGEGGEAVRIDSTPANVLSYSDNILGLAGSGGRISYFVEAAEGPGNQFGFRDVARSNEVLADVEEKVFLPNAFFPIGLNSTFRPVGSFIGQEGYMFTIYDRWGQLIFETHNPSASWDGRINGTYVPQGVYVYILRFTSATGELILRKGTVAVIF